MPRDPWARLASPFSHDALAWRVAEVDEGGALARLAPVVGAAAVVARLDEVVGAEGWSFHLTPMGTDVLVGNLTVQGVTRAALVRVDHRAGADPGRHADEALATAALGFGIRPPIDTDVAYWVDYDPDAGEPLHLPDVDASLQPNVPEETDTAASARPEAPDPDARPEARTETRPPGAHEVIERLIERLREEGLGKEAALLVVRYQGYGRTPEESRELYGRLRSLLLEKGATVP